MPQPPKTLKIPNGYLSLPTTFKTYTHYCSPICTSLTYPQTHSLHGTTRLAERDVLDLVMNNNTITQPLAFSFSSFKKQNP